MKVLYEQLETPEGERNIYIYVYRIANAQDKMTKDVTKKTTIKDDQRVVLRDLDRIMGRWKGCFDNLLDEENHMSVFEDGVSNDGFTNGISRNEVEVAISRMKNG